MNIDLKDHAERIFMQMWEFAERIVRKQQRKKFIRVFSLKGETDIRPPFASVFGEEFTDIGRDLTVLPGLRMQCISSYRSQTFTPHLSIGNNVTINANCHIACINRIVIGNDVLIGSDVLITDHSHGSLEKTGKAFNKRELTSKGPVVIKSNVWIGEHACVMPGVTIGEGSIIGANAVVTHDVPPYSVAAGVPARVVKRLDQPSK